MTIWPPKKAEPVRPAYRSPAKRVLHTIEAGDLTGDDRRRRALEHLSVNPPAKIRN